MTIKVRYFCDSCGREVASAGAFEPTFTAHIITDAMGNEGARTVKLGDACPTCFEKIKAMFGHAPEGDFDPAVVDNILAGMPKDMISMPLEAES